MPTAALHMPGTSSLDQAWEAALAWMTRDQECRLIDILEWRAPETQSRSPSRNMSKPDRLKVVRLLIKALQQDEIDATQRAQGPKRRADEAPQRKQRDEWPSGRASWREKVCQSVKISVVAGTYKK